MNYKSKFKKVNIIMGKVNMQSKKIFLTLLALTYIINTSANVEPTSGRFTENNLDLTIKVIGGDIKWNRDYLLRHWYFNRAWDSLKIIYENSNNGISSIHRGNEVYMKLDSNGKVFKYGKRNIIKRLSDNSWLWKDRNGNYIKYASDGRTISINSQAGPKISLIYNSDNKISGVKDVNNNQVMWIEYDAISGQVSKVKDYGNRQVTYTWEAINTSSSPIKYKLISVKDARGNDWAYAYYASIAVDGFVNMLSKTTPESEIMKINYGGSGRVKSVTSYNGAILNYQFDYIKSRKEYYLKISNQSGQVRENWYDRGGKVIRTSINNLNVFTMTKDLRKEIEVDFMGRVTTNEYDEFKNLLKTTYPDGKFVSYTYDISNSNVLTFTNERGVVTKNEYWPNGKVKKRIEALGTIDERAIEYTYDVFGQLKSVMTNADINTESTLTEFFYDSYGNIIRKIDPKGIERVYSNYDSQGSIGSYLDGSKNTWNYVYDKLGSMTSIKSPLQFTTLLNYDKNGFITSRINPDLSEYHTSYISYGFPDKYINELTGETKLKYSVNGTLSETISNNTNKIEYEFDILDRIKKKSYNNRYSVEYIYPQNSNTNINAGNIYDPIRIIFPTYSVDLKYDLRSRIIEEKTSYQRSGVNITDIETFTYDAVGNVLSILGSHIINERYEYDNLNRVVKIYKNDILNSESKYDDRDNSISFSDANQNKHIYEYDKLNNLTKEYRPNINQFSVFTYNSYNKIESKTDPIGNLTKYYYDIDGRNIKLEYYNSSQVLKKTIEFVLNTMGSIIHYNDGVSTGDYTFNHFQQKVNTTVSIDGQTFTHSYSYYNNGVKKSFTGVDGIKYDFFYNENGQLVNIVIPNKGNITYSNFIYKNPQGILYPNDINKTLSYSGNQEVLEIDVTQTSTNTNLMNHKYTYNGKGQVSNIVTLHGSQNIIYDAFNRVTESTHPTLPTENWEYDLVGNRLLDTNTGINQWSYNLNNELIDSVTNKYVYDAAGNLVAKQDQNSALINGYKYDESGRLVLLQDNNSNGIFEYYYDPFGNRVYKKDLQTTNTTYFHYADEGLTYEKQYDGSETNFLFYPSTLDYYSQPILKKTNTEYYYYLNDRLGTSHKIINANGIIKQAIEYSAFGISNKYITTNGFVDYFRFPGQYYDGEKLTSYNINRDYDPNLGRYIQKDPLGIIAGANEYVYVYNNPLNSIDPNGLCVKVTICVGPSIDFGGKPKKPKVNSSASASIGSASIGTGGGSILLPGPGPGPGPGSNTPPPCGAPNTSCSGSFSGVSCSFQYCYQKSIGCKNCDNNCQ